MTDKEREDALFGESSSEDEAVIPTRPVPRRQRDQSPVNVRYGTSQVKGLDGKQTQTQLCLIRGCPYPARVLQNFRFCSRTCDRLVSVSLWFGALHLPSPHCVLGFQPIGGGVFQEFSSCKFSCKLNFPAAKKLPFRVCKIREGLSASLPLSTFLQVRRRLVGTNFLSTHPPSLAQSTSAKLSSMAQGSTPPLVVVGFGSHLLQFQVIG
jgi:hypothetical protein